jgi:hypothetical protein
MISRFKKPLLAVFAALCLFSLAPEAKADVLISFPVVTTHYHPYYVPPRYNPYAARAAWIRAQEMRRLELIRAREMRFAELHRCHPGWR